MATPHSVSAFVALVSLTGALRAQAAVPASVETTAVPSDGDAADDAAIWIHPTERGLSNVRTEIASARS